MQRLCSNFKTLLLKKTGFESRRAVISRFQLLKVWNDEFDPKISRNIAIAITRYINSTNVRERETVEFAEEIRRRLLYLHEYNCNVQKISGKYPRSKQLNALLVRYIELSHEVLYNARNYSPEYEKTVEENLLRFLQNMMYDVCVKIDQPTKTIVDTSTKSVLKLVVAVRKDYRNDKKLVCNLVDKLLSKMGLLNEVNSAKTKRMSVPVWSLLREPDVQKICKRLCTSDYGTDDSESDCDSNADCDPVENIESIENTSETRGQQEPQVQIKKEVIDEEPEGVTKIVTIEIFDDEDENLKDGYVMYLHPEAKSSRSSRSSRNISKCPKLQTNQEFFTDTSLNQTTFSASDDKTSINGNVDSFNKISVSEIVIDLDGDDEVQLIHPKVQSKGSPRKERTPIEESIIICSDDENGDAIPIDKEEEILNRFISDDISSPKIQGSPQHILDNVKTVDDTQIAIIDTTSTIDKPKKLEGVKNGELCLTLTAFNVANLPSEEKPTPKPDSLSESLESISSGSLFNDILEVKANDFETFHSLCTSNGLLNEVRRQEDDCKIIGDDTSSLPKPLVEMVKSENDDDNDDDLYDGDHKKQHKENKNGYIGWCRLEQNHYSDRSDKFSDCTSVDSKKAFKSYKDEQNRSPIIESNSSQKETPSFDDANKKQETSRVKENDSEKPLGEEKEIVPCDDERQHVKSKESISSNEIKDIIGIDPVYAKSNFKIVNEETIFDINSEYNEVIEVNPNQLDEEIRTVEETEESVCSNKAEEVLRLDSIVEDSSANNPETCQDSIEDTFVNGVNCVEASEVNICYDEVIEIDPDHIEEVVTEQNEESSSEETKINGSVAIERANVDEEKCINETTPETHHQEDFKSNDDVSLVNEDNVEDKDPEDEICHQVVKEEVRSEQNEESVHVAEEKTDNNPPEDNAVSVCEETLIESNYVEDLPNEENDTNGGDEEVCEVIENDIDANVKIAPLELCAKEETAYASPGRYEEISFILPTETIVETIVELEHNEPFACEVYSSVAETVVCSEENEYKPRVILQSEIVHTNNELIIKPVLQGEMNHFQNTSASDEDSNDSTMLKIDKCSDISDEESKKNCNKPSKVNETFPNPPTELIALAALAAERPRLHISKKTKKGGSKIKPKRSPKKNTRKKQNKKENSPEAKKTGKKAVETPKQPTMRTRRRSKASIDAPAEDNKRVTRNRVKNEENAKTKAEATDKKIATKTKGRRRVSGQADVFDEDTADLDLTLIRTEPFCNGQEEGVSIHIPEVNKTCRGRHFEFLKQVEELQELTKEETEEEPTEPTPIGNDVAEETVKNEEMTIFGSLNLVPIKNVSTDDEQKEITNETNDTRTGTETVEVNVNEDFKETLPCRNPEEIVLEEDIEETPPCKNPEEIELEEDLEEEIETVSQTVEIEVKSKETVTISETVIEDPSEHQEMSGDDDLSDPDEKLPFRTKAALKLYEKNNTKSALVEPTNLEQESEELNSSLEDGAKSTSTVSDVSEGASIKEESFGNLENLEESESERNVSSDAQIDTKVVESSNDDNKLEEPAEKRLEEAQNKEDEKVENSSKECGDFEENLLDSPEKLVVDTEIADVGSEKEGEKGEVESLSKECGDFEQTVLASPEKSVVDVVDAEIVEDAESEKEVGEVEVESLSKDCGDFEESVLESPEKSVVNDETVEDALVEEAESEKETKYEVVIIENIEVSNDASLDIAESEMEAKESKSVDTEETKVGDFAPCETLENSEATKISDDGVRVDENEQVDLEETVTNEEVVEGTQSEENLILDLSCTGDTNRVAITGGIETATDVPFLVQLEETVGEDSAKCDAASTNENVEPLDDEILKNTNIGDGVVDENSVSFDSKDTQDVIVEDKDNVDDNKKEIVVETVVDIVETVNEDDTTITNFEESTTEQQKEMEELPKIEENEEATPEDNHSSKTHKNKIVILQDIKIPTDVPCIVSFVDGRSGFEENKNVTEGDDSFKIDPKREEETDETEIAGSREDTITSEDSTVLEDTKIDDSEDKLEEKTDSVKIDDKISNDFEENDHLVNNETDVKQEIVNDVKEDLSKSICSTNTTDDNDTGNDTIVSDDKLVVQSEPIDESAVTVSEKSLANVSVEEAAQISYEEFEENLQKDKFIEQKSSPKRADKRKNSSKSNNKDPKRRKRIDVIINKLKRTKARLQKNRRQRSSGDSVVTDTSDDSNQDKEKKDFFGFITEKSDAPSREDKIVDTDTKDTREKNEKEDPENDSIKIFNNVQVSTIVENEEEGKESKVTEKVEGDDKIDVDRTNVSVKIEEKIEENEDTHFEDKTLIEKIDVVNEENVSPCEPIKNQCTPDAFNDASKSPKIINEAVSPDHKSSFDRIKELVVDSIKESVKDDDDFLCELNQDVSQSPSSHLSMMSAMDIEISHTEQIIDENGPYSSPVDVDYSSLSLLQSNEKSSDLDSPKVCVENNESLNSSETLKKLFAEQILLTPGNGLDGLDSSDVHYNNEVWTTIHADPSDHSYNRVGDPLLGGKCEKNELKDVFNNLIQLKESATGGPSGDQVDISPLDSEHIFSFTQQIIDVVDQEPSRSLHDFPVDPAVDYQFPEQDPNQSLVDENNSVKYEYFFKSLDELDCFLHPNANQEMGNNYSLSNSDLKAMDPAFITASVNKKCLESRNNNKSITMDQLIGSCSKKVITEPIEQYSSSMILEPKDKTLAFSSRIKTSPETSSLKPTREKLTPKKTIDVGKVKDNKLANVVPSRRRTIISPAAYVKKTPPPKPLQEEPKKDTIVDGAKCVTETTVATTVETAGWVSTNVVSQENTSVAEVSEVKIKSPPKVDVVVVVKEPKIEEKPSTSQAKPKETSSHKFNIVNLLQKNPNEVHSNKFDDIKLRRRSCANKAIKEGFVEDEIEPIKITKGKKTETSKSEDEEAKRLKRKREEEKQNEAKKLKEEKQNETKKMKEEIDNMTSDIGDMIFYGKRLRKTTSSPQTAQVSNENNHNGTGLVSRRRFFDDDDDDFNRRRLKENEKPDYEALFERLKREEPVNQIFINNNNNKVKKPETPKPEDEDSQTRRLRRKREEEKQNEMKKLKEDVHKTITNSLTTDPGDTIYGKRFKVTTGTSETAHENNSGGGGGGGGGGSGSNGRRRFFDDDDDDDDVNKRRPKENEKPDYDALFEKLKREEPLNDVYNHNNRTSTSSSKTRMDEDSHRKNHYLNSTSRSSSHFSNSSSSRYTSGNSHSYGRHSDITSLSSRHYKTDPYSDSSKYRSHRVDYKMDHRGDYKTESKIDYKSNWRTDYKMEPKTESKSSYKDNWKTDCKVEPKTESKSSYRGNWKTDYKVEPKMESKSDYKFNWNTDCKAESRHTNGYQVGGSYPRTNDTSSYSDSAGNKHYTGFYGALPESFLRQSQSRKSSSQDVKSSSSHRTSYLKGLEPYLPPLKVSFGTPPSQNHSGTEMKRT